MSIQILEHLPSYKVYVPPAQKWPVVFDSPHSGLVYPEDFKFSCKSADLDRTIDRYVDELFDFVTDKGMPLLTAAFCRSYIDLNRARDEIDPQMLESFWPDPVNLSEQVKSGGGLIRKIGLTEDGKSVSIYDHSLTIHDIMKRIKFYYTPYHQQLENLLTETAGQFGSVWHINCHSMPSHTGGSRRANRLPDFVIGDYSGTSCAIEFTRFIQETLEDMGYQVAINTPYKGLELIRRYSAPSAGWHSLQLEINRDLYMDQTSFEKQPDQFIRLKADLEKLVDAISVYTESHIKSVAAE